MPAVKKKDVIEHFGSEAAAADALEISRQAVNKWGEVVPEAVAYRVHALSKGKVPFDPEVYSRRRRA